MSEFNLLVDSWIPVRWQQGANNKKQISITEVFQFGNQIEDFDCAPHEKISLLRLLVCLTQSAHGVPDFPADWVSYKDGLEQSVLAYISRPEIHSAFELFGDDARFLQTPIPDSAPIVPASKLFPRLATGNNPTLLDHYALSKQARQFPAHILALALLTFQNFYPLYGAGFKGKGPCVDGNALHSILLGKTLIETIIANCLDQNTVSGSYPIAGVGQPIWEVGSAKSNESYLGRLVPQHRSLWLTDDCTGFRLSNTNTL